MRHSNIQYSKALYVNYIVLRRPIELSGKTGASLLMVGTNTAHRGVVGLGVWPIRTGGETQLWHILLMKY